MGFHVERHYTGCRHGKGPLDGAGAVVKSGTRRADMGMNIIINSTEDFFISGKENLKTTFLFDISAMIRDNIIEIAQGAFGL